ncbi:MAG: hypothetical protein QW404_03155, partial [Candidatus Nanoarchaeia archaeon]
KMETRLEGLTARIKMLKNHPLPSQPIRFEISNIEKEVEGIKGIVDVVKKDMVFKVNMITRLPIRRVLACANETNVLITSSSESGFITKKTAFIAEGGFEDLKKFQEAIVTFEKSKDLSS